MFRGERVELSDWVFGAPPGAPYPYVTGRQCVLGDGRNPSLCHLYTRGHRKIILLNKT